MAKGFDPNIGVKFGKRDVERMGIFVEMSYLIGKKYVDPYMGDIRQVATGRQMFPGYPKSKSATQDGYFAEKFLRIFEKEALTNMFQRHLIESIASSKKNVGSTAFRPAGATKKHSCPGDYHGTFIKNMPALTPQLRPKAAYKKQLPNVRTKPGKKGGYGYADITLSKYPDNMSDPFDAGHDVYLKNYVSHVKKKRAGPFFPPTYPRPYFDVNPYYTEKPVPTYKSVSRTRAKLRGPGKFLPSSPTKMEGGCKAGCFDKFPAYIPSPFDVQPKRSKRGRPAGKLPFYPSQGVKPYPQHSIVSHNVDLAVNAGNWQSFQPIVYP